MSKPWRFSICMLLGLAIVWPTRVYLEANYPMVDKLIVVISGFVVLYWAGRHLYEKWDL